jgi:hypothetical protein
MSAVKSVKRMTIFDTIQYEDLVDEFVSKSVKRMTIF